MFDNIALGKKVKYYRNKRNLSQKELASFAGMKQSTISRIERGIIGSFNIKKLSILADALNVTLDDLLYESITQKQCNEYEKRLKELLLTLNEKQLRFYNNLIKNFIAFKQQK